MSRNYIRLKQIEPSEAATLVKTSQTGDFLDTGYSGYAESHFYLASNPDSYTTTGEVTGALESYSYPLIGNPSRFIVSSQTGILAGTGDGTGEYTGWIDSNYYPRSNPSGYVTSSQTGILAGTGDSSSEGTGWVDANYYPRTNPTGYVTINHSHSGSSFSHSSLSVDSLGYSRSEVTGFFSINDKFIVDRLSDITSNESAAQSFLGGKISLYSIGDGSRMSSIKSSELFQAGGDENEVYYLTLNISGYVDKKNYRLVNGATSFPNAPADNTLIYNESSQTFSNGVADPASEWRLEIQEPTAVSGNFYSLILNNFNAEERFASNNCRTTSDERCDTYGFLPVAQSTVVNNLTISIRGKSKFRLIHVPTQNSITADQYLEVKATNIVGYSPFKEISPEDKNFDTCANYGKNSSGSDKLINTDFNFGGAKISAILNTGGTIKEFVVLDGGRGYSSNLILYIGTGPENQFKINSTPTLDSNGTIKSITSNYTGTFGSTPYVSIDDNKIKLSNGSSIEKENFTYHGTLDDYRGFGYEPKVDVVSELRRLKYIEAGGFDGEVRDILLDSNEKIFVVGDFTYYNNVKTAGIAKINKDGTYDELFNNSCSFLTPFTHVINDNYDQDYIYVASSSPSQKTTVDGNSSHSIFKINKISGTIDETFSTNEANLGKLFSNDQISAIVNLYSGYLGVVTSRKFSILDDEGSYVTGVESDFRLNSALSIDDGNSVLLSSRSYTPGGIRSRYNNVLYPLGLRLFSSYNIGSVDSEWKKSSKAGTAADSNCGKIVSATDGSYYIVGNSVTNLNAPNTYWNNGAFQNRFLYSEDFSNSDWVKEGEDTLVTSNTDVVPYYSYAYYQDYLNPPSGADTISDEVGSDLSYIYQDVNISGVNGLNYFSVFVKKDTDLTRFPVFKLELSNESAVKKSVALRLNTSGGYFATSFININSLDSSQYEAKVEEAVFDSTAISSNYWKVTVGVYASNDLSGRAYIYPYHSGPVGSTPEVGGDTATAGVGSVTIWGAQFRHEDFLEAYNEFTNTTGEAIISGGYNKPQSEADRFRGLYKINQNGIDDKDFACNIRLVTSGSYAVPYDIDSLGRVYVGGPINQIDGQDVDSDKLYRLTSSGSLDKVFDQFNGRVLTAKVDSCGDIIVGGRFTHYGVVPTRNLAILDANGNLKRSFGGGSNDKLIFSDQEPDASQCGKVWIDTSNSCKPVLRTYDTCENTWSPANTLGKLPNISYSPYASQVSQGGYYTFNGGESDSVSLSVNGYPHSVIYYTVGSGSSPNSITLEEPTTGSNIYSNPIEFTNSSEENIYFKIKAFAKLEFYNDSEVSSSNYLVSPRLPKVDFTADDGAPKQSSITLTVPGHSGATIYYRVTGIDNTEEACNAVKTGTIVTEGSYTASGISPLTVSLTSYSTSIGVQAIASKQNFRSSRKNSACYWVAGYGSNGQLPLVNYSPESDTTGVFPIEVTPTVLGHPLQSGVVIYYTTDGAEPTYTNSYKLKYPNTSLNFDVDADECNGLIKSFATRFLYTPSLVSTGAYVKETYTGAEFAPASGGISLSSGIFITGEDLGTDYTAYYSTSSGDADSLSGILYNKESGIRLENTSEISFYARVYKTGYCVSDLISGTYSGAKAPSVEFAPEQSEIRFGANNVSLIADGFTIYYETGTQLSNTNAPTSSSLSGTSPITLSVTTDMAIRAYAVGEGYVDGEISEITYSKGTAPSVVFSPNGGDVKFGANGTEISISPITATGAGDAIYFDTGDGFKVYNGSFTINSGYEISGYIVADGLYNGPTGSALFSQKQLSGVSFSPSGDRNHDVFPFSVSISTTQDGIDSDEYDIYYVTGATGSADTTPSTDDNLYSTPFTITESGTVVAAIVSGDGYLPSETGIITYLLPKLENITFLLNN